MIQYENIVRLCCKKYKTPILNCFVCSFSLNLISIMMPLVLSKLIDFICDPVVGIKIIMEIFIVYCILMVGYIGIDFIYAFNWQHLHNEMINRGVALTLFHKLLKSDSAIFLNEDKGNLYTILTKDKDEVLYTVQLNIIQSGTSLIALILALVGVLHINLYFGIIMILFNFIPNILISHIGKENQDVGAKYRRAYSESDNLLIDVYGKYEVVKSLGVYDYVLKNLYSKNKKKIYARIAKEKNEIIKRYVCKIINIFVLICLYLLSIAFAQKDVLTLGGFLAAMLLITKMQDSINIITSNYILYNERKSSLSHVNRILGFVEEIDTGKHEVFDSNITFHKLSFSYSDNKIYDDVDICYKTNTISTIMGESGSGKTTLVKILLGHLCNYKGDYFIGNRNSKAIEKSVIRDNICCMQQEHILFKRDLLYNITLGRTVDKDKMDRIVRMLKIDQFLDKHLQGWNTIVDEENTLSGGEIQKILIARTLLSDANYLIFDEPTSALDKESTSMFFELIQETKKDKIIILLTHDLEAIRNSDFVYRIVNQRINEVRGDTCVS